MRRRCDQGGASGEGLETSKLIQARNQKKKNVVVANMYKMSAEFQMKISCKMPPSIPLRLIPSRPAH